MAFHQPVAERSGFGVEVERRRALVSVTSCGALAAITPMAMRNIKAMITAMICCWLVSFMIQNLLSFAG
jgi:hypothetical protein